MSSQFPSKSLFPPEKQEHSLEKPFVIELWEEDKQPGGYFTPAAALIVTPALRSSGLLRELSPDDLKSLVYLLTFVSADGHCQPFLSQLAEVMRVSPAKAKARMKRLCEVRWKKEPVVIYSKSASGLSAYSLNPRIVEYRHRTKPTSRTDSLAPAPAERRDAVIEYSRRHYARSRAEVERMIARQMGLDVDETEEERKVRFKLENVGLTREQATELLANYHLDTIAQQLDWLPYRHATNPAGYLIAAIEGNYSEPRAVREQRILRELRYGEHLAALHDEKQHEEKQHDDEQREDDELSDEVEKSGENQQSSEDWKTQPPGADDQSAQASHAATSESQRGAFPGGVLPVDLRSAQTINLPLPGDGQEDDKPHKE